MKWQLIVTEVSGPGFVDFFQVGMICSVSNFWNHEPDVWTQMQ